MTDVDNESIPELDLGELTAKFGPLGVVVKMAHDCHRRYVPAYAASYGMETPRFTAWRDSLEISELDSETESPENMKDEYGETCSLYDAVRLSDDPAHVASLIAYLNELLTLAKENLQGIYYDARKSASGDPTDVVKLRAELDSYLLSLTTLAETPQLDADEFWRYFPHKIKTSPKTGAKRVVYDGPAIPQTRSVSDMRKNSRLGIWIESEPGSPIVGQLSGDFGAQCLSLGYTIAEFRQNFYPDGLQLDSPRTHPDGRKFHLRKVEKS